MAGTRHVIIFIVGKIIKIFFFYTKIFLHKLIYRSLREIRVHWLDVLRRSEDRADLRERSFFDFFR